MSQVKVWNDNTYKYEENFKGDYVSIPPKEFIIMEHDQAIDFKGTMNNVIRNADGVCEPRGYKMIRLEKIPEGAHPSKKNLFRCEADGKMFDSSEELDSYIKNNHTEKLSDPKIAKKLKEGK